MGVYHKNYFIGELEKEIGRGMALAFFASAYADQADECGQPLRGEIMEQLPDEIDSAAWHAAATLASGMLVKFFDRYPRLRDQGATNLALVYRAARVKREASDDKGDRDLSPELFGHYCAMQAMGHGVGLESFGSDVRDAIDVPYVEFGSHSLEKDYFEDGDE